MIFYFSGTGNSYYAAREISKGINEEIIDIAQAMKNKQFDFKLRTGEKAGFVFPVYFYGIPTIVAEFIHELALKLNGKPYVYAVMTCGGSVSGADQLLRTHLKKNGYPLSACFELPMVDNYVLMYELSSLSEQKIKLEKADQKLLKIREKIEREDKEGYTSGVFGKITTQMIYPFYKAGRKTAKFSVDEHCTSCGLCEMNCPENTIVLEAGKPVWVKDQCIHCLACINACPVEAIQYGKHTKKRRRYVHPIMK
ncbi:MAG: EFR1 family ferrodoxin [Clostridiaceae bacterium]